MKNNPDVNLINGVKIILFQLGNLKKSESLCIISDTNTKNLGELFEYVSRKMKIKTTHKIIFTTLIKFTSGLVFILSN